MPDFILVNLPHVLDGLLGYFHDDVRGYALQALRAVTLAAVALSPPVPQSDPRLPALLSEETGKLLDETLMRVIDTMRSDVSREVAASACRALAATT